MSVYLITKPYLLQVVFTLIVIGLLSKTAIWFGSDNEFGIQKNHFNLVSRLGGLGIGLSIFSGIFFINSYYPSESYLTGFLMVAFMPIFIGGLVEDITHKVSPFLRLSLASISSLAVVLVTRVLITHTDITFLDSILKIPLISLLLTMLLIVGFLNSVNIIDGFNGLASGSTLIMLISFGVITFIVDDFILFRILLLVIISNICFLIWNWPYGKIFLGDSGAYLLGIWVVVIGILIPHRNNTISPMATVLIGSYPMVETLFSIYRRKFIRRNPVSRPDALHLHTLIYRRLIYKNLKNKKHRNNIYSNSKVALYIWPLLIIDAILAIKFLNNTYILLAVILMTVILYLLLYLSIVKFKTPKFIIFRSTSPRFQ